MPTVLLAAALLSAAAPAQARNDEGCPWCGREAAADHGPMPLLASDSAAFAAADPGSDWRFLETEHFRIASALGPSRLGAGDLERLGPDLERLRQRFPELPKRPRRLDPWLRLHWYGMRLEDFYRRFQDLLAVTDADFPERRGDGPFMGDGRYLGEREKFEVILHEDRGSHFLVTEAATGVRVTDSMRWHSRAPHKMVLSVPAVDSDLRRDRWLLPHLVHNLSHNLLAAYKHFSYDPPVWIDEGLAHAMEREIEPESWTREGEEGTYRERGRSRPWAEEARRLARRPDRPTLAALMRRHTIGELSPDEHVLCWSLARFLIEEQPAGLAAFLGGVKGQLDERGYPSGKDLPGLQRRLMREIWDWSPNDLDAAWQAWVAGGAD